MWFVITGLAFGTGGADIGPKDSGVDRCVRSCPRRTFEAREGC